MCGLMVKGDESLDVREFPRCPICHEDPFVSFERGFRIIKIWLNCKCLPELSHAEATVIHQATGMIDQETYYMARDSWSSFLLYALEKNNVLAGYKKALDAPPPLR